jgi:heme-degrading monooxygenase HmoA
LSVLVFERYPVDPPQSEAFQELALVRIESMRAAPGILWAELLLGAEEGSGFLVLSEWRNEGDADSWEADSDPSALDAFVTSDVTRRRFLPGS